MDLKVTHNPPADRAKSRLKKDIKSNVSARRVTTTPPLLQKYLKFSPLLLIAILNGVVIWNITTKVDPEQLQHVLLPNSYAPMLLLLISLSFFLGSYTTLNTGRGARIALITGIFFFLRVQHVSFTFSVYVGIGALFLGLELFSALQKRKLTSKNHSK